MAVPDSAQRDAAEAAPHPGSGRVFMTGSQALVRVLIEQAKRDAAAGLRTAGYASGYRGSPLGGLDQAFARAEPTLAVHHITFQPGLNEELAATALWGTQQVGLFDGAKQDGVFGLWYGKGPGVDRAGDAFKHANLAGTAPLGGVLAVAGDDHAAASSTTAHQSEFALADAMMPVLVPATVQEILDLGLAGIALSRFAGCWTALKLAADTAEGAATVRIDQPAAWRAPADFTPPPDGLHIRWPDRADAQEARLVGPKMQAAHAFARANDIDRLVVDAPSATRGIVAAGKAWSDLVQALADLGLDAARCQALGLRLYKVALVWPLEPQGARRFAAGLDEVLVVEEKRPLIESHLRDLLYDLPDAQRPRVLGKRGRENQPLLPASGELTPHRIAGVVARWLGLPDWADGAGAPAQRAKTPTAQRREKPLLRRQPHFCSGCPHSRATRTPEGSRALAGIGCHTMALWTDPATKTLTQMGGEGATWIGQAPFTETPHVFQNIGDGTFAHSGLLAIRAAVAAGVNITYRLLFNDAVAMTGGQPVEGALTVPRIARILEAEGVARIIVAAEEPERYSANDAFPRGVTVTGRDALDCAQRELREVAGVTVLIFDQTCAAEKRRRRGRGEMAPPSTYAFINETMCENCGDCVTASNCLSVVPVETEFGRKRRIDQASCNADLSCVDGFCPSFVTVENARLRKKPASALTESPGPLPAAPELPTLDRPFAILIAGIGGTGVVTLGRILGHAAEIAGQAIAVTDQTGLAQKGGAVLCHLRIAATPAQIGAARIGPARDGIDGADVILGCDLVVAAGGDVLARAKPGAAKAIVNSAEAITGSFLRQPDTPFPGAGLQEAIRHRLGAGAGFIDAAGAAARLTGQSATANALLLGYAWQKGLIPLAADAIHGAIETVFRARGEAIMANNRRAFDWGRRLAADGAASTASHDTPARPESSPAVRLDELVSRRAAALVEYQNAALAARYRAFVAQVRAVDSALAPSRQSLSEAVAANYFKLLAAKDEYEVARLFTTPAFRADLARQFEGPYRLHFHLAPSFLAASRDGDGTTTGRPRKRRFGPWLLPILRLLAAGRGLRGTWLDPFAGSTERRLERALLKEYEQTIASVLAGLKAETYDLAVEIARLPESIRGFGMIKQEAAEAARRRREELLATMNSIRQTPAATVAAE